MKRISARTTFRKAGRTRLLLTLFTTGSLLLVSFCVQTAALADACSQILRPAWNVQVGGIPSRIAVDDFNKDGKPDMAVTSGAGLAILLGGGAGNFGPPSFFPIPSFGVPVASGDFNLDGNTDLAVGSSDSNVWIYSGDGIGGFSTPVTFPTNNPGFTYDLAVADFNGDHKPDLVNANPRISILLGDGNGSFAAPTLLGVAAGADPTAVKAFDFNNDGNMDLAASNNSAGSISIFFGDGLGNFGAAHNYPAGNRPCGFGVGDFNGDAKIDLAIANTLDHNVQVFWGDGSGGFNTSTNFPVGQHPQTVRAADFNGDGNLDLATGNTTSDDAAILLGDGAGGFSAAVSFAAGDNPVAVTVADLNLDGKPDVMVPNYFDHNVSVLLNSDDLGLEIKPLFDTTKARKIGSTVPIKLQVLNCSGLNVSSASTILNAFDLERVGGTTSAPLADSGNSNPDYNFRYDESLGGYIFNLSTNGLASGQYVLSFYVGTDRSFFYTVKFEVK